MQYMIIGNALLKRPRDERLQLARSFRPQSCFQPLREEAAAAVALTTSRPGIPPEAAARLCLLACRAGSFMAGE
jgi:hypothetical protein